jgi:hypothetical protein
MISSAIIAIFVFVIVRFFAARLTEPRFVLPTAAIAALLYVLGIVSYPILIGVTRDAVVGVQPSPVSRPVSNSVHDTSAHCVSTVKPAGSAVAMVDGISDERHAIVTQGGTLRASTTYIITGWASDRSKESPAEGICLMADGNIVPGVKARIGGMRPDVARATGQPALEFSAYDLSVPPHALTPGHHLLQVAVLSSDGSWAVAHGRWAISVTKH